MPKGQITTIAAAIATSFRVGQNVETASETPYAPQQRNTILLSSSTPSALLLHPHLNIALIHHTDPIDRLILDSKHSIRSVSFFRTTRTKASFRSLRSTAFYFEIHNRPSPNPLPSSTPHSASHSTARLPLRRGVAHRGRQNVLGGGG